MANQEDVDRIIQMAEKVEDVAKLKEYRQELLDIVQTMRQIEAKTSDPAMKMDAQGIRESAEYGAEELGQRTRQLEIDQMDPNYEKRRADRAAFEAEEQARQQREQQEGMQKLGGLFGGLFGGQAGQAGQGGQGGAMGGLGALFGGGQPAQQPTQDAQPPAAQPAQTSPAAQPQQSPAPAPAATACRSCGQPIEGSPKFCPNCGTPTQVTCKGCGQPIEGSPKFCPNCGTPTAG